MGENASGYGGGRHMSDESSLTEEDFDALARSATVTGFTVKAKDGGFQIEWSDDPLDFVWQTEAQVQDLIRKLRAIAPSDGDIVRPERGVHLKD